MCSSIMCRVCGKTTWTGCGAHIDAVRVAIPPDQWRPGHDDDHAPNRVSGPRPGRRWFPRGGADRR